MLDQLSREFSQTEGSSVDQQSPEKQPIGNIQTSVPVIDYEELAQAVMEPEKSQYLSACQMQTKDLEKLVVEFSPTLIA